MSEYKEERSKVIQFVLSSSSFNYVTVNFLKATGNREDIKYNFCRPKRFSKVGDTFSS